MNRYIVEGIKVCRTTGPSTGRAWHGGEAELGDTLGGTLGCRSHRISLIGVTFNLSIDEASRLGRTHFKH
jgi:hypothetical protein